MPANEVPRTLRSSIHLSAYSTLQLYWTIGHPRCMKAYSEDLRTKIVEAVERENVLLITCIKNDRFRYTSADTPKSRRLRMGWCSKSRPKNKAPKPNPVDELWDSRTPARAVLLIKRILRSWISALGVLRSLSPEMTSRHTREMATKMATWPIHIPPQVVCSTFHAKSEGGCRICTSTQLGHGPRR